jgi:hypothetical protein
MFHPFGIAMVAVAAWTVRAVDMTRQDHTIIGHDKTRLVGRLHTPKLT